MQAPAEVQQCLQVNNMFSLRFSLFLFFFGLYFVFDSSTGLQSKVTLRAVMGVLAREPFSLKDVGSLLYPCSIVMTYLEIEDK